MSKFEFNPPNGFEDSSFFPDPISEQETREQLQRLHNQTRDFINGMTSTDESGNIIYFRLNKDGILENSTDKETWQATASSGRIILNANGEQLPQRTKLQFTDMEVYDQDEKTIVHGKQGEPGMGIPTGGEKGQILLKKSETDYDTEWVQVASTSSVVRMVDYAIPNEAYIENATDNEAFKYYVDFPIDGINENVEASINVDFNHTKLPDASLLTQSVTSINNVRLYFSEKPSGVFQILSIKLELCEVRNMQYQHDKEKIYEYYRQKQERIKQENALITKQIAEQKTQAEKKEKEEKEQIKQEQARVNARLGQVEMGTYEMKPQVSFMAKQDLTAMTTAFIEEDKPLPINVMVLATPEQWQADTNYKKGDLFIYQGKYGFVKQNVKSLDVYRPFTIGTEALYGARPLPIDGIYPYVYNMALEVGMIVRHNGIKYRAIQSANELLYEPQDVPSLLEVVK